MKLIGMLDSPYVRRVAISLQGLGLRFEHQSLSVFRGFDEFKRINPVVKAPTLVCDDGAVLMDSTLILTYAEALAQPRSLLPTAIPALQRELHLIGLGLAAMEKAVQLVYEDAVRPADKRHEPWVDRVTGQLHAAWSGIEQALGEAHAPVADASMGQAGITVAVAWQFAQQALLQKIDPAAYPRLDRFSLAAEALPAFKAAPHGAGTYRAEMANRECGDPA